jgi:hypothetical protein
MLEGHPGLFCCYVATAYIDDCILVSEMPAVKDIAKINNPYVLVVVILDSITALSFCLWVLPS